MDFDQWSDAVDQALKAGGRGFGVGQVDAKEMWDAFTSNVSPVVFAQRATRMQQPAVQAGRSWGSNVPMPSSFVVRVTAAALGGVGWLCWGFAVLIMFLWLLSLLGIVVGSENGGDVSAGTAAWLFFIGPMAILWALWFVVIGGVWHYLAQRLLIAWHDRK